MQFEFIDYDGGYPNLCFGRLKFKADGKIYEEVVSLISGEASGLILTGVSSLARHLRLLFI